MRHLLLTHSDLQDLDREQLLRRFGGSGQPPSETLAAALDLALETVDGAGLDAHPLDVAEILRHLNVDQETLTATLLVPAHLAGRLSAKELEKRFGATIARMTTNVAELVRRRFETPAGRPEQAERLRRMLMAMVDDVRMSPSWCAAASRPRPGGRNRPSACGGC